MKRGADELNLDPSDRAHKWRRFGLERIQLKEIGFWDGNRGNTGMSSHHAHETIHDCMANKTKISRYNHVPVVEVPADMLPAILKANREKSEVDPLVARFSPDIKYVTAGKTHFTQGHKLNAEGGRTLFNDGKVAIRLRDDDDEGRLIKTKGPLCAVYDGELLRDNDAMNALTSEDNMNASVQLGEDEMVAFGKVHTMVSTMALSQGKESTTVEDVLKQLMVIGLGMFTKDQWRDIIEFRFAIDANIATLFRTVQFTACAGRVRANARDFGLAARLDPRAQWCMMAVMLSQYLCTPFQQEVANSSTFVGRKEVVAQKLKPDIMKEICAQSAFMLDMEDFIKIILKHYTPTKKLSVPETSELTAERGAVLANCGKLILKVGTLIDTHVKQHQMKNSVLGQDKRKQIIAAEMDHISKFILIEEKFRGCLVKKHIYEEIDLPRPYYISVDATTITDAAKLQHAETAKLQRSNQREIGQQGALTNDRVFERLNIIGLNDTVLAFVAVEDAHKEVTPVKHEQVGNPADATNGSQPSDDAACGSQPSDDAVVKSEPPCDDASGVVEPHSVDEPRSAASKKAWVEVKLVRLSVPDATVSWTHAYNIRVAIVHVDDLRPVDRLKDTKTEPLHPSLLPCSGTLVGLYDYDPFLTTYQHRSLSCSIAWAHLRTQHNVENVKVYRVSDKDKTPIITQVRAARSFSKGSLILVPFSDDVQLHDDDVTKGVSKKASVVHPAMISYVEATAGVMAPKKKGDHELPKDTRFVISSPLLAAKNIKANSLLVDKLVPYWAVVRTCGPRAEHNMEVFDLNLREPAKGAFEQMDTVCAKLPAALSMRITIPAMRNVRSIAEGDLLTVPFEWQ